MTYPPQQPLSQDPRYAQAPAYQQYPPQPQYQPAPQGPAQPYPQPQYGGAQAQQQPPQPPQLGGQMPPTAAPKLGESGKGGGGAQAPAPRHLIGRTVIIEPIRIDETTMADGKGPNGENIKVPRPTAYYHLTVVDGGPLQYGDNKDHDISKQHGMTMQIDTPCRFTNVTSDRFGIVNEVRDTMARGEVASVGVIQQGTKGNRPFLMTKCGRDLDGNERPDGDQRFQAATQVWNAIFAKTFQSPEPRSLVAPPPQQPAQVAYQPTAPAGYAQQQPTYSTQATYQPPQSTYQQAVAEQSAPGFQTPYAAANPGTGPYGDGYNPAAIAPQVQQMMQTSPPPANPAFEAWLATLPPEQQAAQRAAMQGLPVPGTQQPAGPGF